MSSPRVRRLVADHESVRQLIQQSSILDMSCSGDPAGTYLFRYSGRGLAMDQNGHLKEQWVHEVRVNLGANYPRVMPELHWLTPIFHPNISANGLVCLGGYSTHWVPSLRLDDLCLMLWDMIRYRNFDISSPYNRMAAEWAKTQRHFILPLDPRPLRTPANTGAADARPDSRDDSRDDSSAPTSSLQDTRVGWSPDDTNYNQGAPRQEAEITFL
ncbi:MAG: ubiquitin-conjugating enzyme E2 [Pirellulaceae bacterium]|nr:ubiquitin-conjugating enzyme E2 [Pirellulaceae bacterium]